MSCPLSSLVNPLKTNQALLFFLTLNQSVGLLLYDVNTPKPDNEDQEDQAAITGIKTINSSFKDNLASPVDLKIVNPGSFSALKANGLINVYGFVQAAPLAAGVKAVEASAFKRIAQLSPVYKVLLPDELVVDGVKSSNLVIGVGMTTIVDAKGQGYMYCLTQNKTGNTCIGEFLVGWPNTKKSVYVFSTPMSDNPPLMATNLAAAFEPSTEKKFIIYQNQQSLRIVESNGNNDFEIPNTDDGRDGTGIAVVPVTSEKTGRTKLYVYYFHTKGKLQRVVRGEDGEWGPSEATKDPVVSDKNTSLTAVRVGSTILLHSVAKDQPGIHWYRDEIKL